FAEHDIGAHYPDAAGHNDGNEERPAGAGRTGG
ncbi:DUF4965 domain-containing protein, partial [Amycolatopsis sp. NPDC049159]